MDGKAKAKKNDLLGSLLVGNGQTLLIKIDITSICKMKKKRTIHIFEAAI